MLQTWKRNATNVETKERAARPPSRLLTSCMRRPEPCTPSRTNVPLPPPDGRDARQQAPVRPSWPVVDGAELQPSPHTSSSASPALLIWLSLSRRSEEIRSQICSSGRLPSAAPRGGKRFRSFVCARGALTKQVVARGLFWRSVPSSLQYRCVLVRPSRLGVYPVWVLCPRATGT